MDDEKIVGLYWVRDERAITETQKKYGMFCYSIAWNILFCSEDSEECVNDTYLNTWGAIPPHRPRFFQAFIGRITRNLALNRYFYASRQKRGGETVTLALHELQECCTSGKSVEELVEEKALGDCIGRFLQNQGEMERILFVRRYWYLDSVHSAAEFCGISETNASTILYRMRKRLKEHLLREDFYHV